MSKRYVIQVCTTNTPGFEKEWKALNHPGTGSPWMTHSRMTALVDAAKLINDGETRELRVVVSRPVYEIVVEGGATPEELVILAAKYGMPDEDDASFQVLYDGPAVTHGDDPTGN